MTAAAAETNENERGPSFFDNLFRIIMYVYAFQFAMNFAQHMNWLPSAEQLADKVQEMQQQQQQHQPEEGQSPPPDGTQIPKKPLGASPPSSSSKVSQKVPACLWRLGTAMNLAVYVTDSDDLPWNFTRFQTDEYSVLAQWRAPPTVYLGKESFETQSTNLSIPLPHAVQYNQTHLYAHVYMTRLRPNGGGKRHPSDVLHKIIPLTKHRKRRRQRTEKTLVGQKEPSAAKPEVTLTLKGEEEHEEEEEDDDSSTKKEEESPLTVASRNTTHDQILLYAKPTLILQLVNQAQMPKEFPARPYMPKQFSDYMDWLDEESHEYYPVLYESQFWITTTKLREVNDTLDNVTVEIKWEPVGLWVWQLMSQTHKMLETQDLMAGDDANDGAGDRMREILMDTNPYLLALTAVVSVLHTVFDFLAFKNDITFFRGRKSLKGISIRSMLINAFFQVVILLYLADNETNYMVLVSNFIGVVIEFWKISKAITVSFSGGKLEWRQSQAYAASKTREYDEIATTHLLYITMPLVTGYGIYSLLHRTHKGWYSWILNTLVGFIYMFGFVMMTPQLFINYKLKSVAHLNWRTMTYKSINTFIDDLFAFVVKMPIMHRLACLRDDVIFLIFCYQRYIYRTDYSRVNEFGQCEEPTEEMLAEAAKKKDSVTPSVAPSLAQASPLATAAESSKNGINESVHQRRGARDK